MDLTTLERRQLWLYLGAIAAGVGVGARFSSLGDTFERALWPALAALLFVTFVQVPLLHVRAAFAQRRFLAAILLGNFVLVPLIVWAMTAIRPFAPAVMLGLLMVLLVPCTDWFLTFNHLADGDRRGAIAVTPLNLILQLLLLPVYLWLIMGAELAGVVRVRDAWPATLVVLVPLAGAALVELVLERRGGRPRLIERAARLPVPLLALVMFLIAGSQVDAFREVAGLLPSLGPLFVGFLVIAALLAKGLASLAGLPTAQGRTLAFSLGSRNSFVVLPLALALPAGWEVAAAVIVLQSLVELGGMLAYLWWIPNRLFR